MNVPDSTPGVPEDFCRQAEQVQSMRAMFGTPKLPPEPVLQGSSADEVVANPRIAIIDDEPINIKVVQKYLRLAGYRQFVTTTHAGRAVELIRTERPDVVLLDVLMPEVGGLEILGQLRGQEQFVDLPVVILTAATDKETKLSALRLGATEFLTKPVDSIELRARLRNVLTVKAHQDRLKSYAWELEREVAARSAELARAHVEVIHCLAKVGEYRDNATGNHVVRVGRYAEIIARRLGLSSEIAGRIRQAAPLHDIGKVGIPDTILLKPGKLDDAEFERIKEHCKYGKQICAAVCDGGAAAQKSERGTPFTGPAPTSSPILQMAATIAYTHHEKWDGAGYPRGLAGPQIPIEGRITAVADVFDALTSRRPYKPAFPLETALPIMKEQRGMHFDPAVVDAFFDAIDEILTVYEECSDTPRDPAERGPTSSPF